MRTTLMLALLAVSLGLTATCLLVIRISVKQEIRHRLEADLEHSVGTFRSIAAQRSQMLSHEAALLADLPSLKALMSTSDRQTIEDGSSEFFHTSGTDFFALTSTTGALYSHIHRDGTLTGMQVKNGVQACILRQEDDCLALFGDEVYELAIRPIYFGPPENQSRLGYVILGYAMDRTVVQQISEVASAEVAFLVGGKVSSTTLPPDRMRDLNLRVARLDLRSAASRSVMLNHELYTVAFAQLPAAGERQVDLVVLKSYDRASLYLRRVNKAILALGVCALLLGSVLASYLSKRITRPLENLVAGAHALGQGDFRYTLSMDGTFEVRELTLAFDLMRSELQQSQRKLLESDRLATIGRMASSISHDLRHHLSTIYANAEFMSLPRTSAEDRAELLFEIRDGVQGMTDLIESLLLFSQTGQVLNLRPEDMYALVERTILSVRRHPECRDMTITLEGTPIQDAVIDGAKMTRALYNLLLNACQAAGQVKDRVVGSKAVLVSLSEDSEKIRLAVTDSGPGISASIRDTLFLPFVSAGKVNGTGLGLTIAQHIAQEHGGEISLEASEPGRTTFRLLLDKSALKTLECAQERGIVASTACSQQRPSTTEGARLRTSI